VSRPPKIRGNSFRIDRDVDGSGPISGRDAGADAEPPLGIDADGECRRQLLGVPLRHWSQAQLVAALAGQCQANQPPAVEGHEIDHLGRRQLGGADEVTLVLPILIVGDDDDLAVTQIVDGLLDGTESRHSASRLPPAVLQERCHVFPDGVTLEMDLIARPAIGQGGML
jgi:hypothetical protein